MAVRLDINAQVTGQVAVRRLNTAVQALGRGASGAAARLNILEGAAVRGRASLASLGNVLRIGVVAGFAAATVAAASFVRQTIQAGNLIQGSRVQFNAFFGDVETGGRAFDVLNEFAGRVPFTLEEIIRGGTALAAISDGPLELGRNLEIVGNLAAAANLDFATAALQYQRVASAGVAAADLLRDRGVTGLLGFVSGVQYTADESVAVFEEAFGAGGRFGDVTANLANTLQGQTSLVQDALFRFRAAAAEPLFEGLTMQIRELIGDFQNNDEALRELATTVGRRLARAFRTAQNAIEFVVARWDQLVEGVRILIALKVASIVGGIAAAAGSLAVGLTAATTAQTAFNTAANLNPYVRIAAILLTVGTTLTGLIGTYKVLTPEVNDNEKAHNALNAELKEYRMHLTGSNTSINDGLDDYTDGIAINTVAINKNVDAIKDELMFQGQLNDLVATASNRDFIRGGNGFESFGARQRQFREGNEGRFNDQAATTANRDAIRADAAEAGRKARLQELFDNEKLNAQYESIRDFNKQFILDEAQKARAVLETAAANREAGRTAGSDAATNQVLLNREARQATLDEIENTLRVGDILGNISSMKREILNIQADILEYELETGNIIGKTAEQIYAENQARQAGIRAAMEAQEINEQIAETITNDIFDGIENSASAWDIFRDAARNAINDIARQLASSAFTDLLSGGRQGGGVGGALQGLISGGGFGGGQSSGSGILSTIRGFLPFNQGGIVPGGAPYTDRVPALLTPGERVIPRNEVNNGSNGMGSNTTNIYISGNVDQRSIDQIRAVIATSPAQVGGASRQYSQNTAGLKSRNN